MMSRKRLMVLVPALLVLVGLCLGAGGCAPQPAGETGDAAAGQTLFTQRCSSCHSAAELAPVRLLIISNLGTLNSAMSGITLTTDEIADIRAFLATQ
jgi:mono/diheme cytochrome c family protein